MTTSAPRPCVSARIASTALVSAALIVSAPAALRQRQPIRQDVDADRDARPHRARELERHQTYGPAADDRHTFLGLQFCPA
jgi:hypothetical protein